MKKKLTKTENSLAVILTKTITEILEISPENDLIEIEIENKVLKITKSKDE